MSKFITYEHGSGEIVFVRRDKISSFRPQYIRANLYRIFVSVDGQSFVIKDCDSLELAKLWIGEQINLVESDGRVTGSKN
jgi:hypothetical protein